MSVINEALKKAQRDRAPMLAPIEPFPAQEQMPRLRTSTSPRPGMWAWLVPCFALGVVVGTAVLFLFLARMGWEQFQAETYAPVVATATPAAALSPEAADPLRSVEQVRALAAPALADTMTNSLAPERTLLSGLPSSTQGYGAVIEPSSVLNPERVLIPPDPAIIEAVNDLRVMGIKVAGSQSRVLLENRVYRIGDLVLPRHGVVLIAVEADGLALEDPHGNQYYRRF